MRTATLVLLVSLFVAGCSGDDDDTANGSNKSGDRPVHRDAATAIAADSGSDTQESDASHAVASGRDASAPDDGPRDLARDSGLGGNAGHAAVDAGAEPVIDAGNGPEPPPPPADGMCAEPGQDCASADCCDGSTCIRDGSFFVCAANCASGDDCVSACCFVLVNNTQAVRSPPTFCAAPVTSGSCSDLELRGNDGTFLGDASSNSLGSNSVCNDLSNFGSQLSSTSIFNNLGTYGSQFSQLSAYNQFTQTPPFLYCASTDTIMNAVSKNTTLPGAIDPDQLCATLEQNGF